MTDSKEHLAIVICGHVDAGKSTTTGRLIFELGGISEREMQKLRDEAHRLGKDSFAFAFYMDTQKEERARGVTISCTTKEFFTPKYHYTIIDAPGHRDFIKNMISGASQADVALLMVPADGGFTVSLAKGDHKAGEVQGQTRQHARLINLLGVKQLIVGVNKMDCDTAKYSEERFKEISDEVKNMLTKVGWKKEFVDKNVAIIPISGWQGDNLIKKSENMKWWNGCDVLVGDKKVHINTVLDALSEGVEVPKRDTTSSPRMPVSGVYNIKGVGDVITGRIEQGTVKPGDEVCFLPTHSAAMACAGKIFSIEMHHKQVPQAIAGDNVGLNLRGLDKGNLPRVGDVMVLTKVAAEWRPAKNFTAQIQVLDHPGELKVGYTPVAFARTGRAAVKMTEIKWRMGKETSMQKEVNAPHLKANDMAEVVFEPQQPLMVDEFKKCEGLGRIAILEGGGVVMLGKVVAVVGKEEEKKK
jgi:elongation factor 1-alpha